MNTKFNLFFCILLGLYLSGAAYGQGTAINATGSPADSSAGLDVDFHNKGVLVPRLTTAERNAIQNPSSGLIIFNKTTGCLNYYYTGNWYQWCGTCIPPSPPVAASNSPLCAGNTILLTASTIPNVVYNWSGPNGFISSQQNPSIGNATPANSGTYSVTSSINGCSSSPATVNVAVTAKPSSSFTWLPVLAVLNDNVTFTPSVTGAIYYWTFQGGNPSTSTSQNPVVQWASVGTFDVSLVVTVNGCSSDTTHLSVQVTNCIHGSLTYSYTGSVQTWAIPSCISSITVDVQGAAGNTSSNGSVGGYGGRVQATLTVTPGSTLNIYVGQKPSGKPGGYNGGGDASPSTTNGSGGGGGGASDLRMGGTALADRIIVAGGGGGGGGYHSNACGGAGGDLIGATGCLAGCDPGEGGTQTAGGLGGVNMGCNNCCGANGVLGIGGAGSNSEGFAASGGGGGGYYGGGGGQWEGGGGGSSWVTPIGSSGITHTQGFQSGNGQITITW